MPTPDLTSADVDKLLGPILSEWMDIYIRHLKDRERAGLAHDLLDAEHMAAFWAAMPQAQVAISVKTRYHRTLHALGRPTTSPTSTRCPSPIRTAAPSLPTKRSGQRSRTLPTCAPSAPTCRGTRAT